MATLATVVSSGVTVRQTETMVVNSALSGANAISRIAAVARWELLDGTLLWNSTALIPSTAPAVAINMDENMATIAGTQEAWTGTLSNGTVATDTCTDWSTSSAAVDATEGNATTTVTWTDDATIVACDQSRRIYCFED